MTVTADQKWAEELAGRLKRIQTAWSDDPGVARQQRLREELKKSLDGVPKGERPHHLEALRRHFPTWQATRVQVVREVQIQVQPPPPLTPEELVTQLEQAAPRLRDSDRAKLSARLERAGFSVDMQLEPLLPEEPTGSVVYELPHPIAEILGTDKTLKAEADTLVFLLSDLLRACRDLAKMGMDVEDRIAKNADEPSMRRVETRWKKYQGMIVDILDSTAVGPHDASPLLKSLVGELSLLLTLCIRPNLGLRRSLQERLNKVISPDSIRNSTEDRSGWLGRREADYWEKFVKNWELSGLDRPEPQDGSHSKFWDQDFWEALSETTRNHRE